MSMPVAIYKIVNALNGKMYIGQSVNPAYRAKKHFWKNNRCVKLGNAIQKHGKENFVFTVLFWCENKSDASEAEQLLIELGDTRQKGYNITPGGYGTGAGQDNPFFGKKHSQETRIKLSKASLGRTASAETKEKMATASRNRVMLESTKEKLRARPKSLLCSERTAEANKNRIWSAEAKAKIAAYTTGRKMSDEAKAKIAAANRSRVWTSESRLKLAASKTKGAKHDIH